MNYPKISIITPSFNQGQFLEETINSVLSQNYPNLEYIIIDGGSEDQSIEIIRKYESHLTYWISEPDRGQAHAINKGLALSTGEIITWLNSDDLFFDGVLNKVPKFFDDDSVVLIYGGNRPFGDRISGVDHLPSELDVSRKFPGKMIIDQPATFFTKKGLGIVGYLDEQLHYGMDYDFFIKLKMIGNFRRMNLMVSQYRMHNESKSVSDTYKFGDDWLVSYNRFCKSVMGGEKIQAELKKLDLFISSEERFPFEVMYEPDEQSLELSFYYFLIEQIQSAYGRLDFDTTIKLSKYLRENEYGLYEANGIDRIMLRSRYLPKFLIRLLRRANKTL